MINNNFVFFIYILLKLIVRENYFYLPLLLQLGFYKIIQVDSQAKFV